MNLQHILFLDIETVSCEPSFDRLTDRMKPLWEKKAALIKNDNLLSTEELFFEKAGIFAEFGKIITIAVGYFVPGESDLTLRVKALASHDEATVLRDFKHLLENHFDQSKLALCAHNGKEFDYPYICRRMLVHGILPPRALDIAGKKPWEILHIDTLEMWKFGDRKNFTSLELLAALFNIPTSKSGIDGSMVNHTYYNENDLDKIAHYCQHDVVVTAQHYLKFNCQPFIKEENVILV